MPEDKSRWIDVKGYEGLYCISDRGEVFSYKSEKYLKGLISSCPYPQVVLYKKRKAARLTIHRLMAISFLKKPRLKTYVNHIDGNKLNNRLDNLCWVTASENSQHAWDTGLMENVRKEVQKSKASNILAMSEARRRKVIDKKTGKKFKSIADAAAFYKMDFSNLSKKLTGKRKNTTDLRLA